MATDPACVPLDLARIVVRPGGATPELYIVGAADDLLEYQAIAKGRCLVLDGATRVI